MNWFTTKELKLASKLSFIDNKKVRQAAGRALWGADNVKASPPHVLTSYYNNRLAHKLASPCAVKLPQYIHLLPDPISRGESVIGLEISKVGTIRETARSCGART